MPYIKKDDRERYDCYIKNLVVQLNNWESWRSGHLNYIITKILKSLNAKTYSKMNEVMGVLECVKQEYYRKVMVPYEERKETENGEV